MGELAVKYLFPHEEDILMTLYYGRVCCRECVEPKAYYDGIRFLYRQEYINPNGPITLKGIRYLKERGLIR